MRGRRISKEVRKLDVVIVAVRYEEDGHRLKWGRGYERHGFVWSDLLLLDRPSLVDHLRAGKKVVAGRRADLEGDFEVIAPLRLTGENGASILVTGGSQVEGDDLNLPLF